MISPAARANVLIVDDDDTVRGALLDRIRHWGHHADEARDGEEAMASVLGFRR